MISLSKLLTSIFLSPSKSLFEKKNTANKPVYKVSALTFNSHRSLCSNFIIYELVWMYCFFGVISNLRSKTKRSKNISKTRTIYFSSQDVLSKGWTLKHRIALTVEKKLSKWKLCPCNSKWTYAPNVVKLTIEHSAPNILCELFHDLQNSLSSYWKFFFQKKNSAFGGISVFRCQ